MEKVAEVIEKVIGLLGYDAYDAFIKVYFDNRKKRLEYKMENEILIKKQIVESDQLSFEQKIELNAFLAKDLNKFKRELQILNIAIDNMEQDADVNNLNDDWILDYLDKASRIADKDTQLVWGKLLSYAASNKNVCSKTLLNSLFLMGTEEIGDFLNICQYCLIEMDVDDYVDRISVYPIIFFSGHVDTCISQKISSLRLQKLQNLGLIDVDLKAEYIFSKRRVRLRYKNEIIEIESDKKIKIGNIRFTYEGFLLYQMTEKIYNSSVLNYILEIWRRRGYRIYLNGRKIKESSFSSENLY